MHMHALFCSSYFDLIGLRILLLFVNSANLIFNSPPVSFLLAPVVRALLILGNLLRCLFHHHDFGRFRFDSRDCPVVLMTSALPDCHVRRLIVLGSRSGVNHVADQWSFYQVNYNLWWNVRSIRVFPDKWSLQEAQSIQLQAFNTGLKVDNYSVEYIKWDTVNKEQHLLYSQWKNDQVIECA